MGDAAIFYFLELPPLPHHSDGICSLLSLSSSLAQGCNVWVKYIYR